MEQYLERNVTDGPFSLWWIEKNLANIALSYLHANFRKIWLLLILILSSLEKFV